MDTEKIAQEVIGIVDELKNEGLKTTTSQLHNLRNFIKRTQSFSELKIYLEYQRARGELSENLVNVLVKKLEGKNPDEMKYFIGNFVRYAVALLAQKGGK